jgi:hypothetical protein
MAGFTTYMETNLINATLRHITYTSVTPIYIALYASDARLGGLEVTGGSYARQVITFIAPTLGVTSNAANVNFPISTAPWGGVTFFGICDALTGGNLLYTGALTTARTLITGDSVSVPIGNISITLI